MRFELQIIYSLAPLLLILQLLSAFFIVFSRTQQTFEYQFKDRREQNTKQEQPAVDLNTELIETNLAITAKTCTKGFHCWRSEPILVDGVPLALLNRISKRIVLRSRTRETKGGKCRCTKGLCVYYSVIERIFMPCQEF